MGIRGQRKFTLFLVAYTISITGSGFVSVALALAVLQLGGGADRVGLVLAAKALPSILLLLVAGVAGDRWSRRSVMVGADLTCLLGEGYLATMLFTGHASLLGFLAASSIVGAGSAFFRPACRGLIAELVEPDYISKANSYISIARSIGGVAGAALGGLIVGAAGPGWAVALDAASFAVSAACIAFIPTTVPSLTNQGTFIGQLVDGWKEFRCRLWLWLVVVQSAIWCLVVLGPVVVLGATQFAHLPRGPATWGSLLGIMGLGEVAGGAAMLRFRLKHPLRIGLVILLFFAPVPAALASPASFLTCVVAFFLGGACLASFGVLWSSVLQRHIPPELLSRVGAYDSFGSLCLLPLGYTIAGPLAAIIGMKTTFLVATTYCLLFPLSSLAVPSVRRLR